MLTLGRRLLSALYQLLLLSRQNPRLGIVAAGARKVLPHGGDQPSGTQARVPLEQSRMRLLGQVLDR